MVVYLRKSIHSLLSVFKKKAGSKSNEDPKRLAVHYTASQHYQENVFIEGSRPQYLEDLHTEAQEGLKIQQQEEHKNGVNFPDDESVVSTDTLCPEQDISSKDDGGSPESRSTTVNSDTTETSSASMRPVLTRQGSTFKPLNPVKRLDKSRRRSRRTTIMGIPNQVQKELALHRSSTFQQVASTQLVNHNRQTADSQSGVVIIRTVDGGTPAVNKEGARVHLSELEVSGDEQLLRKHLQAVYQEEQLFDHRGLASNLCPSSVLRPKSLAVPSMTTSCSFSPSMFSFLQEPQGPVMSISPQATYLSTIIPNAVLPASIEVIQIDRSSSRTRGNTVSHGGSVRTVSKGSLASLDSSVSPSLSRRSDGDGSQANSSTAIPTSASGSNWNESQPTKTTTSNSSPISSKNSTYSCNSQRMGFNGQESQPESGEEQDLVSLRSTVSAMSNPSIKNEHIVTSQGSEAGVSGSAATGEDTKKKQSCTRSLSVMKTKQPPAPPQRTNSLHNNKIRSNSRVQVYSKDFNGSSSGESPTVTENIAAKDELRIPTPVLSSSGSSSPDVSSTSLSPTQASSIEVGRATEPLPEVTSSSPQKASLEGGKFDRTMSPSSGYSSQSGTPTLSPKEISPSSPDKQKRKPVKPERSMSRASSSAASPSSSLTSLSSGTSESVNPDVSTCCPNLPSQGPLLTAAAKELMPTLRAEVRELLNIPPPPTIKAPCPPPPETWVHNRRTFELLCGPFSNVSKAIQKPTQTQDNTVKQGKTQTHDSYDMQVPPENQITDKAVSESSDREANLETSSTTLAGDVHPDLESMECSGTKQGALIVRKITEASVEVQGEEQTSCSIAKDPESQETTTKKDPPPCVIEKPQTVLHGEELVLTGQSVERQQKEMCSGSTMEGHSPVVNNTTSSQNRLMVLDKIEDEKDRSEDLPVQAHSGDAPQINKISPPPTPPPAYQPTPPPSRKTPPSSVSVPPDELQRVQEEVHPVESCWPPPPPPLEGDSVFDGGDEIDFPPPPPPTFMAITLPDVMDSCTTETVVTNRPNTAPEEVVEAVKTSSKIEKPERPYADLPPGAKQTIINGDKAEVIMEVSKDDSVEISSRTVQDESSVSDNVPSMDRAENTIAVTDLASPSNILKPDSVAIEDQTPTEPLVSAQLQPPITVPVAPPLPVENLATGVNFRRQPSVTHRDNRSKELVARHKSAPIPKEDANIPLVTPSLLQMVRLRSVNMTEDPVKPPCEDKSTNEGAPVQEHCPASNQGPQSVPQKPIRKSLTLKSPPQIVKASSLTPNTPSMRLQEAIRMKTAAMSSRGLPCRLGIRSPTYNCVAEPGVLCLKSPEGCDVNKSPASTASFIFSKSTKKVIIETGAALSPEAQASLKQSLAAELMQFSDQSNAAGFSNGGVKSDKVPPPVARKPAHSSISLSQNLPAGSAKEGFSTEGTGRTGAGQHAREIAPPETTTRVTADTIETLF